MLPRTRAILVGLQHRTRETLSISLALLRNRPTSVPDARSILIDEHRRNANVVAASLLKVDREWGLVKYEGLGGYLRGKGWLAVPALGMGGWNRLMSGSSSDARTGGEDGNAAPATAGAAADRQQRGAGGDDNSKKTKARVAFMITAAQRHELATRLGYDPSQIKKLKPLEALLILEHSIKPDNDDGWMEIVARLVRENEEAERLEAEEARRQEQERLAAEDEAAAARRRDEVEKAMAGLAEKSETPLSGSVSATSEGLEIGAVNAPQALAAFDGPIVAVGPSPAATPATEGAPDEGAWYEVVECYARTADVSNDAAEAKTDEVVVALYRTEDEARACMEIKESFATRHREDGRGNANEEAMPSYFIRQRG